MLAEAILEYEPTNETRRRNKETVIRVLQALDFYRENKITDIEQFDKIMEVLSITEAEEKIRKKVYECFQ